MQILQAHGSNCPLIFGSLPGNSKWGKVYSKTNANFMADLKIEVLRILKLTYHIQLNLADIFLLQSKHQKTTPYLRYPPSKRPPSRHPFKFLKKTSVRMSPVRDFVVNLAIGGHSAKEILSEVQKTFGDKAMSLSLILWAQIGGVGRQGYERPPPL